jgi:effector-binding domain-containing protein
MTSPSEPETVQRDAMTLAVRRVTITVAGIKDFFDAVYSDVARVVAAQGATPTGPPLACYYRYDPAADVVDVAAGFPVDRAVTEQDGVGPLVLDAGRVARIEHVGGYDGLGATHGRLLAWASENGLHTGVPFCETYLTEPTPDADPADMRTRVEYPV